MMEAIQLQKAKSSDKREVEETAGDSHDGQSQISSLEESNDVNECKPHIPNERIIEPLHSFAAMESDVERESITSDTDNGIVRPSYHADQRGGSDVHVPGIQSLEEEADTVDETPPERQIKIDGDYGNMVDAVNWGKTLLQLPGRRQTIQMTTSGCIHWIDWRHRRI